MEQTASITSKKKWYKRKWIYVVAILLLIVGGSVYAKVKKASAGPQYETSKVLRGNVTQTVDATGNVESAGELDLRFENAGRIGKVYKRVNDTVVAGDIIVELDLKQLNAQVAQAKASLDKILAGNTPDYIANYEARLSQAQSNLAQVRATSESAINTAQAAADTAQNNLQLASGGQNSKIVQNSYDDMVTVLGSTQNVLVDGLNQADNILGIDNTLANDSFEGVLSSLDNSKLNSAKNLYSEAKSKLNDFSRVSSLNTLSPHSDIDAAAQLAETALVKMRDLLSAVSDVLDATLPVGSLTQTSLSTMRSTVITARGSVTAKYATLVNTRHAIVTAGNSYATYQIAYDKAVNDLETARKKADADIASYQALVDQAQASLNDVKNPARREDVASAQASLASAVAMRDKSRIVAPVSGTIVKINDKIGEFVSSQDNMVKLVSPHFEVKIDIPETDIVKISLGNIADIKLDAFGDDIHFKGVVTQIEKGETVIQDVVYYTVTVSMENDAQHTILNGMTANVVFATQEKQDVLYIPQRAVLTNDQGKYTRVLENKKIKEVLVKTGLRGDGGFVEITDGLQEGQEIVLSTKS